MAFPYTRTRNQIIKRALRIAGVVAQKNEPSPEQLTEATDTFHDLLKALSNEGLNLWKIDTYRIDITAEPSTVTHNSKGYLCLLSHTSATGTIEPGVSADWHKYWKEYDGASSTAWANTTAYVGTGIIAIPDNIISIERLWERESQADSLVELINHDEFAEQVSKYTPGTPTLAWFHPGEVNRLHFDYSPNQTNQTYFYLGQTLIDSFTGASDTQDAPGQMVDALTYALAAALADEYQLPLDERSFLAQKASAKMKSARGANREPRTGSFIRSCY